MKKKKKKKKKAKTRAPRILTHEERLAEVRKKFERLCARERFSGAAVFVCSRQFEDGNTTTLAMHRIDRSKINTLAEFLVGFRAMLEYTEQECGALGFAATQDDTQEQQGNKLARAGAGG